MKPSPDENCDSWIHDAPRRQRLIPEDGINYHLETDDERQQRLEEWPGYGTRPMRGNDF